MSMRIAVIGATGYLGQHLVDEATARGHQVTSVSRSSGADFTSSDVAQQVVADHVVVLVAVAPRGDMEGKVRPAIAQLAGFASDGGTRLGVVGGAGSLNVAGGGPRLVDTPEFPEAYKAESLEMADVLDDLRANETKLDWFYISPAAGFGGFAPGEKTGSYRLGGDVLLADEKGESFISGADFALAILDEVENRKHVNQRFTAAY
ncbi:NAD(P)-dependent oxidoreductase [Aestuariimicrobium kwangyangense]|uniref:NAD(P)-dependent oxidoreductase n=1 Tax=Aestuariimicrobium kwangyangense TaxID=396389 RepID=UPI00047ADFD0|nr:NAD(P)H-binding protein [Aestuariimicrobium kwangyangense]